MHLLQALLAQIRFAPHVRITWLGEYDEPLIQNLLAECKAHHGVLELFITDVNATMLSDEALHIKILSTPMALSLESRAYEFIIVYKLFKSSPSSALLKKIYRGLENLGNLIAIETSHSQAMEEYLETANFVAINPIEVERFHMFNAKKMHSWGGGL